MTQSIKHHATHSATLWVRVRYLEKRELRTFNQIAHETLGERPFAYFNKVVSYGCHGRPQSQHIASASTCGGGIIAGCNWLRAPQENTNSIALRLTLTSESANPGTTFCYDDRRWMQLWLATPEAERPEPHKGALGAMFAFNQVPTTTTAIHAPRFDQHVLAARASGSSGSPSL